MKMTTLLSVSEVSGKLGDGIENASMGEKVVFGGQAMLIGMGVVFGVLLLLIGILQLFKLFAAKDNGNKQAPVVNAPVAPASVAPAAPVVASNANSDEALVVAIASSAIAAANGKNNVDFNILSIAPIGTAQPAPAPVAPASVAPAAPAANPAPAPAAAPATPAASSAAPADGEKINAPLPGNVLDVKVSVGASVKKGDILCILEAMKMENEIVAPCDGTVATVAATKGSTVNTGDLLFVIG